VAKRTERFLRAVLGLPDVDHVLAQLVSQLRGELNVRVRQSPPAVVDDDPENPANWIGLDYVHDRVVAQLEEQGALWEDADSRLRLILGVIGIVFAVTLGLLQRATTIVANASGGTTTVPMYLPFLVGVPAIVGLSLFAVAGVIALVAYWPRDFNLPPAPGSLRKYITSSEREVKLTVVDEMLEAYEANTLWLGRKFLAFRWALIITGIATAALGFGVIIQLAQVTRAWG
jgi:hypothetical protein